MLGRREACVSTQSSCVLSSIFNITSCQQPISCAHCRPRPLVGLSKRASRDVNLQEQKHLRPLNQSTGTVLSFSSILESSTTKQAYCEQYGDQISLQGSRQRRRCPTQDLHRPSNPQQIPERPRNHTKSSHRSDDQRHNCLRRLRARNSLTTPDPLRQ